MKTRSIFLLFWLVFVRSAELTKPQGQMKHKARIDESPTKRTEHFVVEGTKNLFNYLFDEEAPAGFGEVIWCSFYAPFEAAQGNAVEAVDSAVAGVAALSAGVFEAVTGTLCAGLLGPDLVLGAVAVVPGMIIRAFDTSQTQYRIQVYNFTKYPVFLDASMVNPRSCLDIDGDQRYTKQTGAGPGVFDKECFPTCLKTHSHSDVFNEKGMVIPPTAYDPVKGLVGSFCMPLYVMDSSFKFALRFFAREGECRQLDDLDQGGPLSQKWWSETRQPDTGVKYSWAVGCASPWSRSWSVDDNCASIWPAAENQAPEHEFAYDNMVDVNTMFTTTQGEVPEHKASNSACYWKDDWKTLVVQLGMPDEK